MTGQMNHPPKNPRQLKGDVREVFVTRVGLMLPGSLTYETWERTGTQLARIADSSAWCLGDWMVYGTTHYANRYLHAIEKAGLEYQTLRNYAWVARRFQPERRRATLSFQHHTEVASLPESDQEMWLDRAEREGWSRNKLRRSIQEARAGIGGIAQEKASIPRIHVAENRLEYWKSAAKQQGTDFTKWVVSALDIAASRAFAE